MRKRVEWPGNSLSLPHPSLGSSADLRAPKFIRGAKIREPEIWLGEIVTTGPDGRVICLILNPFYFPFVYNSNYLFFCTEFKQITLKLVGQLIWDLETAFIQNLLREQRI